MKCIASVLIVIGFLYSSIALANNKEQKAEIDIKIINEVIKYIDDSNLPHKDVKQLIQYLRTAKIIKQKEENKTEDSPKK